MAKLAHHYHMKDWKETPVFDAGAGSKVTRVEAAFKYEGEVSGSTKVHYLMRYLPEGTGTYQGWEFFEGQYRGAPGSILLRHGGSFQAKGVEAQVESDPSTGTGSLLGTRLQFSTFLTGHGPYPIDIEIP